jgi:hypothetical protein
LTITRAVRAGNLLGNLLCGVAGLLGSDASNTVIANLLNELLGLLDLQRAVGSEIEGRGGGTSRPPAVSRTAAMTAPDARG